MTSALIPFEWNGEAMVPRPAFVKRANETFTVHEIYRMDVVEERSLRSHSHYFACINECWLNLPEHLAERFPSADHLRRYALVKAGFRDERSIVCASKAEAQRVAAFVRPMDGYAVVVVREAVVVVWTAKSQSMKAMGKADFQRSKDAVLDICAELIGVAPETLRKESGRAA